MPPQRDSRLVALDADQLLYDLFLYRCAACGLWLVLPGPNFLHRNARHQGCAGLWQSIEHPFTRTMVLRFLTRQMLSGGPRWERF